MSGDFANKIGLAMFLKTWLVKCCYLIGDIVLSLRITNIGHANFKIVSRI